MKIKKWRSMLIIIPLTLITIGGFFYYRDKPDGVKTDQLADKQAGSGEITNASSLAPGPYGFPGETGQEKDQTSDNGGTQQAGGQVVDKPENPPEGNTYNNQTVVEKNTGTNVSQPQPEKNEGTSSSSDQNSDAVALSRSASVYNKLSPNKGIYGQFRYRELGGGRIEIDPQWVAQNIVTITLPGLNRTVQVNRAAKDNFIKAFNYIKNGTAIVNGKQVSLLSLIKTMDGTFVSRHVNWNPSNGLSNHSWGTAIDINASSHFGYVSPSQTDDPNLILWEKAFKPAGFSWGNSYSDSMHFELLNN